MLTESNFKNISVDFTGNKVMLTIENDDQTTDTFINSTISIAALKTNFSSELFLFMDKFQTDNLNVFLKARNDDPSLVQFAYADMNSATQTAYNNFKTAVLQFYNQ